MSQNATHSARPSLGTAGVVSRSVKGGVVGGERHHSRVVSWDSHLHPNQYVETAFQRRTLAHCLSKRPRGDLSSGRRMGGGFVEGGVLGIVGRDSGSRIADVQSVLS